MAEHRPTVDEMQDARLAEIERLLKIEPPAVGMIRGDGTIYVALAVVREKAIEIENDPRGALAMRLWDSAIARIREVLRNPSVPSL